MNLEFKDLYAKPNVYLFMHLLQSLILNIANLMFRIYRALSKYYMLKFQKV